MAKRLSFKGAHELEQPQLETLAAKISKERYITVQKVRVEIFQRASELLQDPEIPESKIHELEEDILRSMLKPK